jgi:glycosyltransferase involved in cell wall biosynthesis
MLEAMQEGVPVLASDIPVHKQLIAPERGLLFRVGDVDSCVHCLDWAIHHPQELAEMAKNAQEHVQDYYNWDDITTKTLNLYTTLSTETKEATQAKIQLSANPARHHPIT